MARCAKQGFRLCELRLPCSFWNCTALVIYRPNPLPEMTSLLMHDDRPAPIFILAAARSGSTLLRALLDAHPDIACPSEAQLCNAVEAIHTMVGNLYGRDESVVMPLVRDMCSELAARTLGAYSADVGKVRWCDKSLPTLAKAALVADVFPDAQFVWLCRGCIDTIASIQESTVWGHAGLGLEAYVHLYPNAPVAAYASYWLDSALFGLSFESAHPDRCHRLLYEDLVSAPKEMLSGVFDFLDVGATDDQLRECLEISSPHTRVPGDWKIRYTSRPHQRSVGRGWYVPIETLPRDLRERVDRVGVQLGYKALQEGVAEEPMLAQVESARFLGEVTALFDGRVTERLAEGAHRRAAPGVSGAMCIYLVGLPRSWVVDFDAATIHNASEQAEWNLMTDAQTLIMLARGLCDPAVAFSTYRLRLSARQRHSAETTLKYLDAFVSLVSDVGPSSRGPLQPSP